MKIIKSVRDIDEYNYPGIDTVCKTKYKTAYYVYADGIYIYIEYNIPNHNGEPLYRKLMDYYNLEMSISQ